MQGVHTKQRAGLPDVASRSVGRRCYLDHVTGLLALQPINASIAAVRRSKLIFTSSIFSRRECISALPGTHAEPAREKFLIRRTYRGHRDMARRQFTFDSS
jgi:hypothetical protein